MKRSLNFRAGWLPSLIGAALLAALATPPTHAADTRAQIDGLKKAANGFRQLAAKTCTPDKELAPECTKQTTWLKNAAGRCDALARKLQAAGAKGASVDGGAASDKDLNFNVAAEYPNLRSALQKENGEFSFKSQEAKSRQQEATQLLKALGQ